jgi:hypothetical protein
MPTRVQLPKGCTGLDARDGKRYDATRPGGSVVIEDRHASQLAASANSNRSTGLLSANQPLSFGTKAGRWCAACRRLWNVWNDSCPRCGGSTSHV